MRAVQGPLLTTITSGNRRREVVAMEDLVRRVLSGFENLAFYTMIAAFWGVILYVALTTFVMQ